MSCRRLAIRKDRPSYLFPDLLPARARYDADPPLIAVAVFHSRYCADPVWVARATRDSGDPHDRSALAPSAGVGLRDGLFFLCPPPLRQRGVGTLAGGFSAARWCFRPLPSCGIR